MKKTFYQGVITALIVASAAPVFAANNVDGLIIMIGGWINKLVPMAIALGLLLFLFGLARWILSAGNDDAQKEGKNLMVWGVIALAVMVSVWGLVKILQKTVGIENGDNKAQVPAIPTIPGGNSGGTTL